MENRQVTLTRISELLGQDLALADQIEDTFLGVLIETAFQHIEGNVTFDEAS